ncbi:MAG TPA: MarR family transcriptional regulator [Mycobacteriales bacterium]|nr:MarR family transcriptional regulator [Mycobacteriales bacterium]
MPRLIGSSPPSSPERHDVSREPLGLPFDPIERAGEIWQAKFGPAAAMRVATSVMRAQQLLLARYDELLKPYGLTFARYEALVLLHFSHAGELPLSMIGERLMVHPTSVTNIIGRLATQGFVERRPNPQDGRGVLARLTASGRQTVKRATDDLMADDFGLGMYDERTLEAMFEQLRALRVAAGDYSV